MSDWRKNSSVDAEVFLGIFDAVQKIDEAKAAEDIVARLRKCLEQYGVTACLVTGLPLPHKRYWHKSILHNGWPRSWFKRYNARGHYRHDPCAERSRRTAMPFLWSELSTNAMLSSASLVLAEAREFGLCEGMCVPVHAPFTPPGVVTMSGEALELPPPAQYAIQVLCWHAFHALRKTQRQVRSLRCLSKREGEVLQWASGGKTVWEVSRILGISFHTTNTHMRNARQKLGTVNLTHSVVEALRRNEIQP